MTNYAPPQQYSPPIGEIRRFQPPVSPPSPGGVAPEGSAPTIASARQTGFCHACGASIDARAVLCTKCGVAQQQTEATRAHPQAAVGLILNLFFPGVGTLVLGKTTVGIIQLILWLISIPLAFVLIGWPLYFGVWVWALIVSVQSFSNYRVPGGRMLL